MPFETRPSSRPGFTLSTVNVVAVERQKTRTAALNAEGTTGHAHPRVTWTTASDNMSGRESARERGRSAENSQNENVQLSEMTIPFPQWECLDHSQINKCLDLPVEQVQSELAGILDFKKHQTCMKDAALLDYFVNGFWWAKEMNFTCQQISFTMALLQQLLDNIKNKQASFADNFKVFTQMVLATRLSSSTEPHGSDLFDTDQIKSITDFFSTSFFQHYGLYELLFTHQRQEQLLGIEKCIEVVSPVGFSAPLEEGMPADLYFQYVAPPRVQTPEQCLQESHEVNGENPGKAELEESDEDHTGFSVEDVREVLGEMTQEMLAKLQADFTEKLRAHEETYSARLDRLQKVSFK